MRQKKFSYRLLCIAVLLAVILSALWLDHSSQTRIACVGTVSHTVPRSKIKAMTVIPHSLEVCSAANIL